MKQFQQLIDVKVRQLLVRGSYGDTVLLQLIAANCDSAQFAALVQQLVFLLSAKMSRLKCYHVISTPGERTEAGRFLRFPAVGTGQEERPFPGARNYELILRMEYKSRKC